MKTIILTAPVDKYLDLSTLEESDLNGKIVAKKTPDGSISVLCTPHNEKDGYSFRSLELELQPAGWHMDIFPSAREDSKLLINKDIYDGGEPHRNLSSFLKKFVGIPGTTIYVLDSVKELFALYNNNTETK